MLWFWKLKMQNVARFAGLLSLLTRASTPLLSADSCPVGAEPLVPAGSWVPIWDTSRARASCDSARSAMACSSSRRKVVRSSRDAGHCLLWSCSLFSISSSCFYQNLFTFFFYLHIFSFWAALTLSLGPWIFSPIPVHYNTTLLLQWLLLYLNNS